MIMLTQYHLKLHSKSISLLYSIERCDYLINDARKYLNNNTQAPWFQFTKDVYVKQYLKYRAIKYRLLKSYANTIEKIARPAMESNARAIGNIVVDQSGKATGNPIFERYEANLST